MGMNNGYGLDVPVSPETVAQVNYEADLLNRISALGYQSEVAAKKAAKEIHAVIRRTHDESERARLMVALERLSKDHGMVLTTREQVDHLLAILRVNDWEEINAEVVIGELRRIIDLQQQGVIAEVDSYDIMGTDVRPYLKSIWSNTSAAPDRRKEALEAAKRLDVVRMLAKTRALNALSDLNDTPALIRDYRLNADKALDIAEKLGVKQDMEYTLQMFAVSERELANLNDAAAIEDKAMVAKGLEADLILSQGDPEMDQLITVSFHKDEAARWLIGGVFFLALGYILRGRGA